LVNCQLRSVRSKIRAMLSAGLTCGFLVPGGKICPSSKFFRAKTHRPVLFRRISQSRDEFLTRNSLVVSLRQSVAQTTSEASIDGSTFQGAFKSSATVRIGHFMAFYNSQGESSLLMGSSRGSSNTRTKKLIQ